MLREGHLDDAHAAGIGAVVLQPDLLHQVVDVVQRVRGQGLALEVARALDRRVRAHEDRVRRIAASLDARLTDEEAQRVHRAA